MPAAFERCVRNGGRVRTKSLGNGKYIKICFLNGKSYSGEIKQKKSSVAKSKKSNEAAHEPSGRVKLNQYG